MEAYKKPVFLDINDLMRRTVKTKRKAENTVIINNQEYTLELNYSYLSSLIQQNARVPKRKKILVDNLDHNVEWISAFSIPLHDFNEENITGEVMPTEPELINISQEHIVGEDMPTEPELIDISQEHIAGEDMPTESELLDISQEHIAGEDILTEPELLDISQEHIAGEDIPTKPELLDISQEHIAGEDIPTESELLDISQEHIAGEDIPPESELLDISQEHIAGEGIPTEPELLDISQEHVDDTQNPGLLKSNEENNEEPMDEQYTKAPDTIKPNQSDSVTVEENVKSFTFSSTWEPKANYNFTIKDNVNSFSLSSTLGSNAPMPSNKLNESSDLEMLPKRFGKTKVCFLNRHNLRLKDFICNEEDDFSLVQPRLSNITSHLKTLRNKDNWSHWQKLQNHFCDLPSTEYSELDNPFPHDDISSASETLSENLQVPPTNSVTSGEYQFPAEFCNNLVLTQVGYFKNYV